MSTPSVTKVPFADLARVAVAYAAAALVALFAVQHVATGLELPWRLALLTLIATLVTFVFSRLYDNTSIYDPYWSLIPIGFAFWLVLDPGAARAWDTRQVVLTALCTVYGIRLTYNWARGWGGMEHEDWRYRAFRSSMGRLYWPFSLVGLHLFPTVMTWLGALSLIPALAIDSGPPFGSLDVVASSVTATAIIIETVADEQLRSFRSQKRAEGDICNVGLWAWSRHPNYFGEILFWVGLWMFSWVCGGPAWFAVGWVAMVALFVGASIPMAEKRSLARRPGYAEHQKKVSMLVPLPPR